MRVDNEICATDKKQLTFKISMGCGRSQCGIFGALLFFKVCLFIHDVRRSGGKAISEPKSVNIEHIYGKINVNLILNVTTQATTIILFI